MKKCPAILVFVVLLALPGAAGALIDVNEVWPDWTWSENAQYAAWDSWNSDGGPDIWVEWDHEAGSWDTTHEKNGFTSPYFTSINIMNDGFYETFPLNRTHTGAEETIVEAFYEDGLVFYMDNYDLDVPQKQVRLIVNFFPYWQDSYTPGLETEVGVDTNRVSLWGASLRTTGEEEDPTYIEAGDPVAWVEQSDGWVLAAWDLTIEPNPGQEWISLLFYDPDITGPVSWFEESGVYIDEFQLMTRSVPVDAVPVPGAALLLCSGTALLALFRRRA